MPAPSPFAPNRRPRLVAALALALTTLALVLAALGDDAPAASTATWSYEGATGPERWGRLDPAYATCGSGRRQSPIALSGRRSGSLPALRFDYRDSALRLENNGHSIEAEYEGGGGVTVGGRHYELVQFHFHAPSEHLVGTRRYPVELHFVHRRGKELLVLGVFVVAGRANPAWEPVLDVLPKRKGAAADVVHELNARDLLPKDAETATRWAYPGSLTTPPCTEGVHWHVLRKPLELSAAQIRAFRASYVGNGRPLQKRGDRPVRLG